MTKPSEISAARFLALRAAKSASARTAAGERLRFGRQQAAEARLSARAADMVVEAPWRYVAAHVSDAPLAWLRDVGLPAEEFVLGTTGKPAHAVAIDRGCYVPGYQRCRCHTFRDGRWRPACHPPIVNGPSVDCDVCEVPCATCPAGGG